MASDPKSGPEELSVCLVEHNPLAARHLEGLLRRDGALHVLSHQELFATKRRARFPASVLVLDRGTLPTPLSKFLHFVRIRLPEAKVIVLDEPQPQQELFGLLFLGIQGFLAYDEVEQLPAAIRAVTQGHLWVGPEILEQYVRYASLLARPKGTRGDFLTRQERRILELVRRRLSNKEISSILGVSESTVKFHLSNIFAKLGVHDRHAVVEVKATRRPLRWLLHKPR